MLPVILSGGSGTRLWPLSTPAEPKQFLPLMDAKNTMIQQTVQRLTGLDFISNPLVICNEKHLPLVKKQLGDIDKLQRPVMLEPVGRNTAPAIIAAALYALEQEPDGLLFVLASDHTIQNIPAFHTAIEKARKAALNGTYVLFGIVPTRAETGYGYIETQLAAGQDAHPVQAFKEKPDALTAQKYLDAGNYFWNSGMFVIPAKLLLEEAESFNPEMTALVRKAYEAAKKDQEAIRLDAESFSRIQGDSIDYAVMEKTRKAVVVPLDAGWSDVGSWDMVWELSQKDENGNAVQSARTFLADTTGTIVRTDRPVALLGIKDCIVIESESGLLIADRKYVQQVKKAAETLTE
ncbi:MAG: mannose-1-phosphate guanylyltransferase/mannose-6-phosphate isomerase [Treponema sp.]|nr:mannose-1-phosphate guanylyltransferase/mannose-6-phosphate isomerase [Treponema sp.]